MDPQKFARISARLKRPTDSSEVGQLLPLTAAALREPGDGRLAAVVAALASERLIVPVPVEVHPDESGEHRPVDLGEDSRIPLITAESPVGIAIVAFADAARLSAWDPAARPMPIPSRKVALTALATGVSRLWLNPAAEEVVIPRPAVAALAHGDVWLPAWKDPELLEELRRVARAPDWIAGAEIRIEPDPGTGVLRVSVVLAARDPGRLDRSQVAGLLAELAATPRLQAAAETVEFVPSLAPLV